MNTFGFTSADSIAATAANEKGRAIAVILGSSYSKVRDKKAKEFLTAGTKWLHIIDLDGARVGRPVNTESIKAIAEELAELKIEVGGGLRDRDSIRQLLDDTNVVARLYQHHSFLSQREWIGRQL